ncbi:alpha/beta fold hydrolase [Salinispirillum marinum]|uniref:Alpha/beta fold hydrolase n=2 Tax=Saccharospirillaceae TaxID=255527 RepID=A0ABV8BE48_9GAMM
MKGFDWQWHSASSATPKGMMVICHGMAEHHRRYGAMAAFLNQHGWHVLTYDHPGHGPQADTLGDLGQDGWAAMNNRLQRVLDYALEQAPALPLWLMGHSMGSFTVLDHACRFSLPAQLKGLILTATDLPPTADTLALRQVSGLLARLYGPTHRSALLQKLTFGRFNRAFKPNRTEHDWVCGDPAVVDAYEADPYCGFPCSVGFWHEFSAVLQRLGRKSHLQNLPKELTCILLAGGRDPVGHFGKGPRQLTQRFRALGYSAELKLYPTLRHEILNEKDNALVWADLQRMAADFT